MTKEEMFKEMEKMAPVLERNGVDIVLGKRIPGSFTRGYFQRGSRLMGGVFLRGAKRLFY